MGVLDEHNRQHTYGNTLGPPTSVVGVAAQQSIDVHNRLVAAASAASASPATGSVPPNWRAHFIFALISVAITLGVAFAAYLVAGIGAAALGLVAVIAGMFAAVFSVAALIGFLKSVFSSK